MVSDLPVLHIRNDNGTQWVPQKSVTILISHVPIAAILASVLDDKCKMVCLAHQV